MYFLGAITGMSGAYSNAATGVSGIGTFAIPPSVRGLFLVPQQSGISFEIGMATGAGFQTTNARAAQLLPNQINGPFKCIPLPPVAGSTQPVTVVGIYSGAASVSVRVYAEGPK